MHGTAKQTNTSAVQSQEKSIRYSAASVNGELLSSPLLVMIRWNVRTADAKCCFLNFTTITNTYLSKNFTRKQCPNLVESVLLHKFS